MLKSGHLAAAAALSIVVAAIYGTIAWGMFATSVDFQRHMIYAERLYGSGRPPVPHFLFHALTAALFASHLAPSLVTAGRLVLVVCYVLIGLVTYAVLWSVFRDTRIGSPGILLLASLAALMAEPITLSHAYQVGYFWPEPFGIPTSTVLKPFALACFGFTAWYLFRGKRVDWRMVSRFALVTLAGALSKPSFIICILPASALLLAHRLLRRLPVSFSALLAGLYIPAAAVLAWQFYASYSGHAAGGMYADSIVWAPFKFLRNWTAGLLPKFLLSLVFPLAVAILYGKQARRDGMLQLAWPCFLIGIFYSYFLAEKHNWADGNFVWSGYITLFTLFVASIAYWLRQADGPRTRFVICAAALGLHVLSGARIDWLYLTHYGCKVDFRLANFVCKGP
jgi:hypothetical protein